jgi:hypothetical protein
VRKINHRCINQGKLFFCAEMEKHEHKRDSEAPMICARKVETTPVPDLNDGGRKVKVSGVDEGETRLALFRDRAEE